MLKHNFDLLKYKFINVRKYMKLIIEDIDLEQSEKNLREFYNSNTHSNQEWFNQNKESIIKNALNRAAKFSSISVCMDSEVEVKSL